MDYYNNELYHYGVLGMKWGRRRYQNPDGSLTKAGKKRQTILNNAKEQADKRVKDARVELDKFQKTYKSKKLSNDDIKKLVKDDFGYDVEEADAYAKEKGYKDHKDMYRHQHDRYLVDRQANIDKKIKFYEEAAKKYGSMKVAEVNNKTIKKAKDFIDHSEYGLRLTGESQVMFDASIESNRKRYGL